MTYTAHGCDALPAVEVPVLVRFDVVALEKALVAAESATAGGTGYPRKFEVNRRMTLLAKYPWMRP